MKTAAVLALAAVAGGLPPVVGTHPGGAMPGGGALHAVPGRRLAAFSRGCFWGMEARFRALPGVVATAVGYMGGSEANPTYESVHAQRSGVRHVETVLVEYDPQRIGYPALLDVFAASHPGPRSVAWSFDDEQRAAALARFPDKARPAPTFWLAEERHQQYNERHGMTCPA